MHDIRQKLLATFQVEHRDHVEQIRSLLAMVAKTDGQLPEEQLEEAFRRAHTLKGAAHVVELRSVEGMAHRLETLFSQVRQRTLPLTNETVVLVQRALDAMEDSVAGGGEKRNAEAFTSVLQAIEEKLGIEPEPGDLPVDHNSPPAPAFQPLDTVRINAQNFDGLLRSAVELLTESQRQDQVSIRLKSVARQAAALEKEAESAGREAKGTSAASGMASRLARLQSEARSVSMQVNTIRRLQHRSAWSMKLLAKQLQRDVWQARMIPAESLLEGYRKMMRDLSREESKPFEFQATSTGEFADRRVLEALKDPLMHALRNAVSHGIEPPNERLANAKPAQGLVSLRIDGDRQRLRITVEDDGRGLDTARIVEVALQRKLLSAAEAQRCSPRDLARVLFSPGFSTSNSITNLSGRGMGLSVVFEAVQRLQGEVDLQPRTGGGTSLQISVPVSIATHRLLLISCASRLFAAPIYWVERLLSIRGEDLATAEGHPMVTVDGHPIPLLSLQRILNLPKDSAAKESGELKVIILRSQGQRTAITVDSFLGQTEAVVQDLGPITPQNGKISGGVLLEDGSTALVLNPICLFANANRDESPQFADASEPAKIPRSILVVDDSMTTRTLEKSILEAHGYRVRVAVNGIDALAHLRDEKIDLVISDVQMPLMDGFGLLAAIKSDHNLNKIPVIIVTSLEKREDQERGLSLGADAYIVKQKFDQGELLSTIRQIL